MSDDHALEGRSNAKFRDRGADVHLRSGPQMREYEAIVDTIARSRPRHLLDWGCGWGQASHMLKSRGVRVTSMEYVPEGADDTRAEARFADVAPVFTSDPVRLPFEDASFDAVVSLGVLEHVGEPEASLDELRRVLAPGGTLWIYKLPNRRSYLERIARLAGLYYHGHFPDDTVYTVPETWDLLERHGFQVRSVSYANMLPLTVPGALAAKLTPLIWTANRLLAAIPLLNRLATNVEAVAARPG